jgi:hypothetical protein
MPANSTSLPSTATSLRPPAGGLVRCRTQAPSATHSHRRAATPQHPEHDFADPLFFRPSHGQGTSLSQQRRRLIHKHSNAQYHQGLATLGPEGMCACFGLAGPEFGLAGLAEAAALSVAGPIAGCATR